MVVLDYKSRTPIYMQIIEQIEKYVAIGILKKDEQIPSVRELATSLGINPNTVKKAYTELERRGVTKTISTKGTFISNNTKKIVDEKIEEKIKSINNIIKEIEQLGLTKDEIIKKIK